MNLRVATFNIRFGMARDGWNSWPFRARATAAVLRGLDADVVGLQEVYGFQARSLRRRLRGHGIVGEGRSASRRNERCSVLWRRSAVTLVDVDTRWFGPDPHRPGTTLPDASHPRIATIATLQPVDGGAPFTFVNTHLDQRHPANRMTAVDQIVGWLDDGPTIVVGDLNARPDSEVLGRLEAAGLRTVLGPDAPGTAHNFTGRTDGPRIDHILVSAHWTVTDAEVDTTRPGGRLPSDHWPVVADLFREP